MTDTSLSAAQVSRRILKLLHQDTHTVQLKGHKKTNLSKWKTDLLTPAILKKFGSTCPHLHNFEINEAVINANKLKLFDFENIKTVEHLGFRDCEFINLPCPTVDGSYFKNMASFLPNLKSLEVSYSNWITDYDLMLLSKLDSLKTLVLKCDLRIGFTTSYLAISFRFGFKALEELDMRGTSLTNMEIQSVSQGGRLKCLKLGPIGRVKRLKNDIDEGFGLVIPDPLRRDEPRQQVVVINMSANGPEWRHANDDDLDMLGLNWLKNRLNKMKTNSEKDDEHFFFGKEGKIVRSEKQQVGECSSSGSSTSTAKRKVEETHDSDDDLDDDIDEAGNAKKRCHYQKDDIDEQAVDNASKPENLLIEKTPPLPTQESAAPDELLSDLMIHGLRFHGKNIERLELVGCAITDNGMVELIKCLPKLSHLDVSQSHVTAQGVQQAQVLAPKCCFVMDSNEGS